MEGNAENQTTGQPFRSSVPAQFHGTLIQDARLAPMLSRGGTCNERVHSLQAEGKSQPHHTTNTQCYLLTACFLLAICLRMASCVQSLSSYPRTRSAQRQVWRQRLT